MGNYKIGDKIQIKSWEEMTKEFEHDSEQIYCNATFTDEMKYLCSKEFIIKEIEDYDDEDYKIIQKIDGWIVSFDMIKLIEESSEENKIQAAVDLLNDNNYIVIKMTPRMLKDAKECDEMEGDKDCFGCSCSQCVLG